MCKRIIAALKKEYSTIKDYTIIPERDEAHHHRLSSRSKEDLEGIFVDLRRLIGDILELKNRIALVHRGRSATPYRLRGL